MKTIVAASPGEMCNPDPRKAGARSPHVIISPDSDTDLQAVHAWLLSQPIVDQLRAAVDDAIRYVLDGARTWRFDLTSAKVDSDERSSVGTKLQYHVIEQLGLVKQPPLDTAILGVAVEIKGTVRKTWMIPREGQCEITLMIQIDAPSHRFRALLMRTHRAWLTGKKGNRDLKRSPQAQAVRDYALEVTPWIDLPLEPLRLLTFDQLAVVFGPEGQTKRLTALFGYLPEIVIPRSSIETVGATNKDPMRRARQAKPNVLNEHGLVVLVGKWQPERAIAAELGHDLSNAAWVAVPAAKMVALGYDPTAFLNTNEA
ncbi:NaeI family type II restriction endonuclease [Rhodococcus sp. NPDC056743]|uniref:NaeI family type II restriction endonuclease n=1 Tax=Rhodococcus sp. NPDC056743 TaxID=3345934 RepID=UPI00366E8312